jgi:TonB family protein
MTGIKRFVPRLQGWVLSLILHGLVGGLAALSAFGVHLSNGGGSGSGDGGGPAGGGGSRDSYPASMRSEELVSGEPVGDPTQYGHVSDDTLIDATTDEVPAPTLPFDVFAVGASDPKPPPPAITDPLTSRPGSAADRGAKLPPPAEGNEGPGTETDSAPGNAENSGVGGLGGTGGGDSGGEGKGLGSGVGVGNATEVYTPVPAYPSDARRRNIQGIVLVEIAIANDGSCAVQRIVESSGCDSLDHAVEATCSRWKYRPADIDGRPTLMTKRVRFVFKLGEKDR